jgi:hypothetical protein
MSDETPPVVPRKRPALTAAEAANKLRLESIVRRNIKGFVDTGESLAEIAKHRLYRDDFKTFKEYLAEEWNLSSDSEFRAVQAFKITPGKAPKLEQVEQATAWTAENAKRPRSAAPVQRVRDARTAPGDTVAETIDPEAPTDPG